MNNNRSNFDPFKVLEVNENCTETDIKNAYKKKSVKLHPDRNNAPDAHERFQELGIAQELLMNLQDPQLKQAYNHGGWEMVEVIKQRRMAMEQRSKVCPSISITVPVKLCQIFQRDLINIESEIPVLDNNGNNAGVKNFRLDVEIEPYSLEKLHVVEHQGIERPDYITGDIRIKFVIDWANEPTKFEIVRGDLMYKHKIMPWEAFGAFNFSFLHPNGKTYRTSDYYDRPNEQGDQIYIVTGAGLNNHNDLIILVNIDYNAFKQVRNCKNLQNDLVNYYNNKPGEIENDEFDVVNNSMTHEQYEQYMIKKHQQQKINFIKNARRTGFNDDNEEVPGECNLM